MENQTTHAPMYKRHLTTVLFVHDWALVGSAFWSISPLLEKCAATATHHQLAQGWVNTCNTRVEWLLC